MWTLDELVNNLAGFFSPRNVALAMGLAAGSIAVTANAQTAPSAAPSPTTPPKLKCDTNGDSKPDTDFQLNHQRGDPPTVTFKLGDPRTVTAVYQRGDQYCVGTFQDDKLRESHMAKPLFRSGSTAPALYLADARPLTPTTPGTEARLVFDPSLIGSARQNETLRMVPTSVLLANYALTSGPALPVPAAPAPAPKAIPVPAAPAPVPPPPPAPAPVPAAPAPVPPPPPAPAPVPAAPAPAPPPVAAAAGLSSASAAPAVPPRTVPGTFGHARAADLVSGLGRAATPDIATLLRDLYAGLPDRYRNNLGCITLPIARADQSLPFSPTLTDRAYVFEQPTNVGATSGRNASLDTNFAMLYRCETLAGVVGRKGVPQNPQLEQWATAAIQQQMAFNVNRWYMGNEAVAQPGDFTVVYENHLGMRVVRGIRVDNATRRQALNAKAKEHGAKKNIVVDSGHVLWLPNKPGQSNYGHDVPASLVRPDSPSVAAFERRSPGAPRLVEDAVGDLLVQYGPSTITLGDILEVPPGGADILFNSGQNVNSAKNDADAVSVYAVTPAGMSAGITRASLVSASATDITTLVTDSKLVLVGQQVPLPSPPGNVEDAGVKVHLEPGKTYVAIRHDRQPGGTAFSARSFETREPTPLPPNAEGTVVVRYTDAAGAQQVVALDGAGACLPTDRAVTFAPEGLDHRLETRGNVINVGAAVKPNRPFDSPASDFNTPVHVPRAGTSLVQYVRQIGKTDVSEREFDVIPCGPGGKPIPPANVDPDAFVGVDRMPGDVAGGRRAIARVDYRTVDTRRPTSGAAADIQTQQVSVDATGRLDISNRDGVAILGDVGYTRTDGTVQVGGSDVQDINGNAGTLALGAELRLGNPDNAAIRAYALARGFLGGGSTSTDLPSAPDGTERSLRTDRDEKGWGGDAGLAGRLYRLALEGSWRYARRHTDEHAVFGGASIGEDTDTTGSYHTIDAHAGLRLAHGSVVPVAGLEWTRETQHADVNGAERQYGGLRPDIGLKLSGRSASNLFLIGYDRETGMLRLYDRLDIRPWHVGLRLESRIPLDGTRDNVRRPADATETPRVNVGVEVPF